MKHTPGPWIYQNGAIYTERGWPIGNADRSQMAAEAGIRPTERDANARLMSKAPAMLRLLERFVDGINDEWQPMFRSEILTEEELALLQQAEALLAELA